jgi:tetratricopeptide (TPR) repeat protein
MKLKHQILIFSVVSMLIANVATAQKQLSQKELSAPQVAPSLSKPEVQRLIKEELEIEESKNEVKIRERVQTEVDRSFGWTMALIQILLGVLTALPIFASIFLLFLRNSIKNQIVEEAKNQVKEKLQIDIKTALKEFDEKTDGIILEINKRMDFILAEVLSRKDSIMEKMGSLVPEISTKEAISESTDPEVLSKLQYLTTTLEELQDRYPELVLTAGDYFKKSRALYYEKSYEEALVAINKSIEIKSDDPKAWVNKGITLRQLQRTIEEVAAYNRAIELEPDLPQAWFNKGIALGQLQRTPEALAAYEKAIELEPDYPEAWINKGVILGQLQRTDEALLAYDKAIELKPNDSDAWFNKACLYGLNGNAELAVQSLKRAIDINAVYREQAKTDSDFDSIRHDQEFKQLIEDI